MKMKYRFQSHDIQKQTIVGLNVNWIVGEIRYAWRTTCWSAVQGKWNVQERHCLNISASRSWKTHLTSSITLSSSLPASFCASSLICGKGGISQGSNSLNKKIVCSGVFCFSFFNVWTTFSFNSPCDPRNIYQAQWKHCTARQCHQKWAGKPDRLTLQGKGSWASHPVFLFLLALVEVYLHRIKLRHLPSPCWTPIKVDGFTPWYKALILSMIPCKTFVISITYF